MRDIAMLDRLHVFVPFLPSACALYHYKPLDAHTGQGGELLAFVDTKTLLQMGIPLQSEIQMLETGEIRQSELRHKWDDLSTGFTPMAFKVFHRCAGYREMPGIELKASPAKLLQGHNLFGPNSIEKGW